MNGKELIEKYNSGERDFRGANLRGAYLRGANLNPKEIARRQIVPSDGSFTAWKKLANETIAKLLIPEDAERVGGLIGRKCRASKVIVLAGDGLSNHDSRTKYTKNETVVPDSWDPDPRIECAPGIHFFVTRQEAEEYEQ
jgi:hypothetical protein